MRNAQTPLRLCRDIAVVSFRATHSDDSNELDASFEYIIQSSSQRLAATEAQRSSVGQERAWLERVACVIVVFLSYSQQSKLMMRDEVIGWDWQRTETETSTDNFSV